MTKFLKGALLSMLLVTPASGQTPKEGEAPATDDAKCRFVSQQTTRPYGVTFDCSKVCDRPTEAAPGTTGYALWHQLCDAKNSNKEKP